MAESRKGKKFAHVKSRYLEDWRIRQETERHFLKNQNYRREEHERENGKKSGKSKKYEHVKPRYMEIHREVAKKRDLKEIEETFRKPRSKTPKFISGKRFNFRSPKTPRTTNYELRKTTREDHTTVSQTFSR